MNNREKLINILSVPIYPRIGADPAEVVADYLMDNDVVPVVRCKDCIYWEDGFINSNGFFVCPASGMDVISNDYCSYGERRDGNATD